MKLIILSIAILFATQMLGMESPRNESPRDNDILLPLIKKSNWPAVKEMLETKNNDVRITDEHVAGARLALCTTEKKCYRSCSCLALALLAFMGTIHLNENSYPVALISRGSPAVVALFAERLTLHGQVKKYIHAQRILGLLENNKNK